MKSAIPHHDYASAVAALEREMWDDARDWGRIARGDAVLSPTCAGDPRVMEAADNLERASWQDAQRCLDARELYVEIRDRPLAEIVLILCEQGYCDHARYILTSDWAETGAEGS